MAAIYAATEDGIRRKAFRARMNYFEQAKVLGDVVKVGKGKRKTYSIAQIERWLDDADVVRAARHGCRQVNEAPPFPALVNCDGYWHKRTSRC